LLSGFRATALCVSRQPPPGGWRGVLTTRLAELEFEDPKTEHEDYVYVDAETLQERE